MAARIDASLTIHSEWCPSREALFGDRGEPGHFLQLLHKACGSRLKQQIPLRERESWCRRLRSSGVNITLLILGEFIASLTISSGTTTSSFTQSTAASSSRRPVQQIEGNGPARLRSPNELHRMNIPNEMFSDQSMQPAWIHALRINN